MMDLSVVSLSNLERFETRGTKATNDADAKIRESLVGAFLHLLFVDPASEKSIPKAIRDSERYVRVRGRLLAAFQSLPKAASRSGTVVGFKHRGGRTLNYDFDIFLSDKPSSPVPLELKFGESIYDQPQILQLYVNSPSLKGAKGLHYGHFFYDAGYLATICTKRGVPLPDRAAYLARVFGTQATTSPFTELRDARISDPVFVTWMDDVVHSSIDTYLTVLGKDLAGHFNLAGLSARLLAQTDKCFLSIEPTGGPYGVEKIDVKHLTATGKTSFRSRRDGRKSSLCVHMKSGAIAAALLRWKNRTGVLGPAWQVDLTPP